MSRIKIAATSIILSLSLSASQLLYYSDEVHYKSSRDDSFVGFGNNLHVVCGVDRAVLESRGSAPKDSSLSSTYAKVSSLRDTLDLLELKRTYLKSLLANSRYKDRSASKMIDEASILADEELRIAKESQKSRDELDKISQKLSKAGLTLDMRALYIAQECQDPTIIINPRALIIKPSYEAVADGAKIKLTHKLTLTNRSGVDIDAKDATLYTYALNEPIRVQKFMPWRLEVGLANKELYRSAMMADGAMVQKVGLARSARVSVKQRNASRYDLKNLQIKADGSTQDVVVSTYKLPYEAQLIVYPYSDRRVYMSYEFKPDSQIKYHKWRVSSGDRVNENGVGRYVDGIYQLYAYIDRDIEIERTRDIFKESEGFFSGTKKRDGYRLNITNHAPTSKNLRIIERIPLSTSDKIEVADVSIEPKGLKYTISKDGKLTIDTTLKPKDRLKIEVKFVIKHDKDIEIRY